MKENRPVLLLSEISGENKIIKSSIRVINGRYEIYFSEFTDNEDEYFVFAKSVTAKELMEVLDSIKN